MLEIKDAVKVSLMTFAELFPGDTYKDLRLEEIAPDPSGWKVTVSYKNPDLEEDLRIARTRNSDPAALLGGRAPEVSTRHYKSISIDAEDGSLVQIKSA